MMSADALSMSILEETELFICVWVDGLLSSAGHSTVTENVAMK